MENNLKVFVNEQFGEIRTIEENSKVLFCATDVARSLGYSNPHDAISRHCKGVVKREGVSQTTNQHGVTTQQVTELNFIPEGDVYRLITHSKLPSAERFERWVFDEVLPSIRRHGAYMTDETLEKALTSPDFLIQLATQLKEEKAKSAELAAKVEQDKPKVLFADAVTSSQNSIPVGELAKLLKQNGIDIGRDRLFARLRLEGYLMKNGDNRNVPTQYSMNPGLFEIKETPYFASNGEVKTCPTTKVTLKGVGYFINRYLGECEQ